MADLWTDSIELSEYLNFVHVVKARVECTRSERKEREWGKAKISIRCNVIPLPLHP